MQISCNLICAPDSRPLLRDKLCRSRNDWFSNNTHWPTERDFVPYNNWDLARNVFMEFSTKNTCQREIWLQRLQVNSYTDSFFLFFLKNLKVNFHKKSQVLWYDQSEEEKVDQRQREWEQNPHRSGNSSLPPFLLWDTAWAFRIMVQTLCPSMFTV